MKKSLLLIAVLAGGIIAGISSCRKEKLQTPFTRVMGKWKKAKFATDDNGNGVIDSREIHLVESGVVNTLEFKGDSTGIETTSAAPDLNFRWQIVQGSSILIQYTANDTLIYTLENITSVDMTITTQSKLGLLWYYYTSM